MTKSLLKKSVTPAEGEISVRTYHCTYYRSQLFGLSASGYLEITNKRVIFQASGESSLGASIIHSEVPVADVSGISSYKGIYVSFGRLIAAFVVSLILSSLVPVITTLVAQIARDYDALVYSGWAIALLGFGGSFFVSKQSIWRSVLASASASALRVVGGGSQLFGVALGFGRSTDWIILLSIPVAIYALVCFFWYAQRPAFSLSVSSKGGSSTPINISGVTGIGIFDAAAGKALTAEPAAEADRLLKELGAVVLDVQTLGDLGVSKWQSA